MKYILSNKIYIFQVIPENKTRKLINYLIFMIKKILRKQNCEEMPQMDKSIGSF